MQTGKNCVNTLISSSLKPKSCSFQACASLLQAELFLMGRDGAREEMLGGAKTVRVPTASEASKILTGHTFQIGLKCDYTL